MPYAPEIAAIIADLDIGDLTITWEWVQAKYVDPRRKWVGSHEMLANGTHRVKIALRYADDKERIKTIAHELRHAWQFDRRICIRLKTSRYDWKGTQFVGPRTNYRRVGGKARLELAEEIDARGYEKDAWARLFEGKRTTAVFVPATRTVPQARLHDMFKAAMNKPI